MTTKKILTASLAGRCANGYESDKGRLVHALPFLDIAQRFSNMALCVAKPGARSIGWSIQEKSNVNCNKCKKIIENA